MGSFSIWHWLVLGLIVLLLFGGRGKLPALARDVAQSINSFKKGMKESKDAEPTEAAPKEIEGQARSEAVEPAAKDQDAKA
jgi:sec-independent protein translocase protein TatA